jgi:two-component system, chemotaxis family, response regulator Rcp1
VPELHTLLVEDNPGDVELIRLALKNGHATNRISVVEDGEQAIHFLERTGKYTDASPPDLILLDLNLPRIDGREVLEAIKTDPKLKHIPVVVFTTSDAQRDVQQAYHRHANCYVTKPADADAFLRAVRDIETFWLTLVRLPQS